MEDDHVAYIGDDTIDWPVMSRVGLSVAVADAHPMLLDKAHYVTKSLGGRGAIRELCDLIVASRGKINIS
jgi:3-deoxy-D-manno-octulosonate 8-phosphate phosphatase (KDO 8-P phosphatase)